MKKVRCLIIFLFTGALVLWCSGALVRAQEPASPVEVKGDQVEYFPKEKKVLGKGNVSIDYKDVRLTCDSITVYTDTKDADAEGNVILKGPVGEVRGQKVKYNFETKQGEIVKAKIKSGEWYAGGEKADLTPEGSLEVNDAYITSCDREKPHYKISAKRVVIYPNNEVIGKNVFFKVGETPVAYLPRYDYSLNTEWPTLDVIPGKKNKWGFFALTSYRYEANENNKITLRLDEREKWGFGEGIDYKYSFENFGDGILRSYFTHQRDMDRNEGGIRYEQERYRVQLRHRLNFTDNISGILEYHRLSDSAITKDYFYREEYDRESSPEAYLYLLDREPEYSLSFLARKRINRFQSVVERLPELRFDSKDQTLFNLPIYFKTDATFTDLNKKTGNSSDDSDVVRFDAYNKFSSPMHLFDSLSLTPFVGTRDTFYSKDINGDEDEYRTAFYSGIDVSTKLAKTYDIKGKFMGVEYEKLRHIVTPTIEYEYIHAPSMSSSKLQQFDDIDNINRKSTFKLGLDNKLQTKRLIDGKLRTFDLGYFLITGDYLYKPEDGSKFSNVKGDLELTPYQWMRIESDTQYDPSSRDFQSWNTDLSIEKGDDFILGFGSRYWQNTEHELTSQLLYKLNSEWSFRLFGRYDLKEVESSGHKVINRFDSKEITVIKDLHCWLAEVSLDVGRDGGTTVWVVMKLKASPKVPFDFKDYYSAPKR